MPYFEEPAIALENLRYQDALSRLREVIWRRHVEAGCSFSETAEAVSRVAQSGVSECCLLAYVVPGVNGTQLRDFIRVDTRRLKLPPKPRLTLHCYAWLMDSNYREEWGEVAPCKCVQLSRDLP